MGSQTTRAIASDVTEKLTNLEAALIFHFRQNHYPPLPLSLIPVAIKIINGEVSGTVELPKGVTYKGGSTVPVHVCIDAWHLEHFVVSQGDYEQED